MRRRLTLALVALVAGALLVAGAGALVVTRSYARHQAEAQLLQQAQALAGAADEAAGPRLLRAIRVVLRLEDTEIITIDDRGAIPTPLPSGLSVADLQPEKLLAGASVSGWSGGIVYVAVPVQLSAAALKRLGVNVHAAILLTRQVGNLAPSWIYFLLVAAGTLLVAAAVADHLSRRISRPLVEAVAVTSQIAAGHLSARVPTRAADYPELTSLADSINAMAANLDGARARERQLLLSVSHDLRTPLTSIRGYAEAIAEGAVEDPARAAGVIIGESRRLERLVADLLDLAKLEMHHLSLDIGPTDGARVVRDTVEGFLPQARQQGVVLSSSLPDDTSLLVAADPDRLAQILANLIENALAYARRAVAVSVVVPEGGPPSHHFVVVVEDDGPGIAPDELEKVFDRFYQADRRGAARGGSGLGLAIVAELVRAMGGTVHAQSPAGPAGVAAEAGGVAPRPAGGGGTRMVVALPIWQGRRPAD